MSQESPQQTYPLSPEARNLAITQLLDFAVLHGLIPEAERCYSANLLLDQLDLDEYEEALDYPRLPELHELLDQLTQDAAARGLFSYTQAQADLFDTRLMSALTPRPAQVIQDFHLHYQNSPQEATRLFYQFCQDSNYIRSERIARDIRWRQDSPYGELQLSLNLSKPEKDPRDIVLAASQPQSKYPRCLLCVENEGYRGRLNHPARQNLRVIPIELNQEEWCFQFSPYVYYEEHCIVFSREHRPLAIDPSTFRKLLDFVTIFPHYFIGSNADLPIVGGSILSHEHFQGGIQKLPIEDARILRSFRRPAAEGRAALDCSLLHWPLSAIRLESEDPEQLYTAATAIYEAWLDYDCPELGIYAHSGEERHNTLNPIVRHRQGRYQMDLLLRNNRCDAERPTGIFHPRAEYHHIKRENIGLIEAMGLAVLPGRLKRSFSLLAAEPQLLLTEQTGERRQQAQDLAAHQAWFQDLVAQRGASFLEAGQEERLDQLLEACGEVFCKVLEDCGLFPLEGRGLEAFEAFVLGALPELEGQA